MNTLVKQILNASTGSNDPMNDFGNNDWVIELCESIKEWVSENDVKNVELYVSDEETKCLGLDMSDVTNLKVNYVETYEDLKDIVDNVFTEGFDGPGWDGFERSDTRWNNNFFFTGSDCSFYILTKKVA